MAILLGGIFLTILPLREQAFRDDFAYVWSVKNLTETGRLKISEWSSAADITQTYWGTGWSRVFGFSFRTLHAANFFMLAVGILAYFGLLKEVGLTNRRAVIFVLLLLANPWILNFTMSYMTDIQAMSWAIVALLFFVQGFKKASIKSMVAGGFAAGLSFLTRQIAISILIGLIVALIVSHLKKQKKLIFPLIFGASVFGGIVILYLLWLQTGDHKTVGQYFFVDKMSFGGIYAKLFPGSQTSISESFQIWQLLFHRFMFYLSQIIVFTLPVWTFFNVRKVDVLAILERWRVTIVSALILGGSYVIDVQLNRKGYSGGYPLAAFEIVPIWPWFWPHLWKFFLFGGIILWIFLPAIVSVFKRSMPKFPLALFLVPTTLAYIWFTITNVWHWPQFSIQLYPFVLLFFAWWMKNKMVSFRRSFIIMTILLAYSVWLTKFRYYVTGELWAACEQLVREGYRPSEIECNGQYSHKAWHEFEKGIAKRIERAGTKNFANDKGDVWFDEAQRRKIRVKVTYSDSFWRRVPKIVIEKL